VRARFRHPQRIADLLVRVLLVEIGCVALGGIYGGARLAGITRGAPWFVGYAADVGLYAVVMLSWLTAAAVSFVWTYRASANVFALGASLFVSPRAAAALQLVPVLNALTTYLVLRQIWRRSSLPPNIDPPPLFYLGWALYATSCALAIGAVWPRDSEPSAQLADVFSIANAVLVVPLDLIYIWIVRRVTKMQLQAHAQQTFS
jgi:hypothetical protein